jgi:hypothetical protein
MARQRPRPDWRSASLISRCGPLSEANTAQIQAPPLERLEAQADDLLDFQGPTDLNTWLSAIAKHQNRPGTRV